MTPAARSSSAATFFDALARRGQEPLLRRAAGTLRFDLTDHGRAEHWFVALRHGEVDVSRGSDPADAVVRVNAETFEGMVAGRVNAMAAVLRGEIEVEGDLGLVLLFQRVFPSPPGAPEQAGSRAR